MEIARKSPAGRSCRAATEGEAPAQRRLTATHHPRSGLSERAAEHTAAQLQDALDHLSDLRHSQPSVIPAQAGIQAI